MKGSTTELLRTGTEAAEGKKAENLTVLDLRGLSSVTDYFVICSGRSDTNVRAIADAVRESLAKVGLKPFGVEGYQEGTWILIDYVDFVFHVFHFEKRLAFALEDLWKDAPRLNLSRSRAVPKSL